jgi:predicted RNA binding protein YcfA (HicA-like mRNA interferase family)
MGKRRTPPLTPSDVVGILIALGFALRNQEGSHAQYGCPATEKYPKAVVTVDMQKQDFDDYLMKSMIRQSKRTVEEFYGATKRSARKASVPYLKVGVSPEPETE